jgi:S-DNA-T family DNA segregation ATPase FtsK/SpoIIIE
MCGIVGAFIAGLIRSSVGVAGFFLPFLGFIWAVARLSGKPPQKPYIKLASTLLFCVATSGFLASILSQAQDARVARGGVVGLFVSDQMVPYFGWWGAVIVFATVGLLCFLLVSEMVFWPLISRAGKSVAALSASLFEAGAKTARPNTQMVHRAGVKKKDQKEEPETKGPRLRPAGPVKITGANPPPLIKTPPVKEQPVIVKTQAPFTREEAPAAKAAEPKPAPKEKELALEEEKPAAPKAPFKLPSLDLLDAPKPGSKTTQSKEAVEANVKVLEDSLREFGIDAKVAEVEIGPVITRYELEPAPGVKVQKITTLSDDLALVLKAPSIRIIAPIPGKARVGIEVPNPSSAHVVVRDVLESKEFRDSEYKLPLAIGKDTAGHPLIADLTDMPHLLIAGTTGSGKTVCVNTLIASILMNSTPEQARFIMVDPKMVELTPYNGMPHLILPVMTDPKKVPLALNWVIEEMETRYKLFAKLGVRNIVTYHERRLAGSLPPEELPENLPYLIVIIDELADLMMVAQQEIEKTIARLAQLSRAVGIHMILATQRPSVDVLTGVIKANFPARISFQVASKVDSRTVLDGMGADKLLGKGDLLFMQPGTSKLTRAQGCFMSDKEIERLVSYLKAQRPAQYEDSILQFEAKQREASEAKSKDPVYYEAVRIIVESGQASVSLLQRRMRLGYGRAARILDMMEEEGIVGPIRGAKPREVFLKEVPDESNDRRASEVGA